MYRYHPEEPSRVDVLSGSNMVWRRDAVDGLEFDEALSGYAYMEDADFALRAGRRGDLWTLPNARLRHSKTTTSRVAYREYVRQVIVNGAYLYAKHRIARNLRPTAYARRLIGRCIAFAALATARRTIQPIGGILDGLAEVPRALRCGAEASRQ
jgi:GT2 family glycosyltransferase